MLLALDSQGVVMRLFSTYKPAVVPSSLLRHPKRAQVLLVVTDPEILHLKALVYCDPVAIFLVSKPPRARHFHLQGRLEELVQDQDLLAGGSVRLRMIFGEKPHQGSLQGDTHYPHSGSNRVNLSDLDPFQSFSILFFIFLSP